MQGAGRTGCFYKNLGTIEKPVTAHALVFETFEGLVRKGEKLIP